MFIHGREDEAERIVRSIEESVERETGDDLETVDDTLEARQREGVPFGLIARTAFAP